MLKGLSLLYLFVLIFSVITHANSDVSGKTEAESQSRWLNLSVGSEVYFFKFEDKLKEQFKSMGLQFAGRQQKLEYKYKPVQTLNVGAAVNLFRFITLSGVYGNGKFSLFQNQNERAPRNSPSWTRDTSNTLYGLTLAVLGLNLSVARYMFSTGKVNVRDVSGDPAGENGPVSYSINNVMEFRDVSASFGIGSLFGYIFDENDKSISPYIRYGLLPLRVAYIYNESYLPVIPYFFSKQNGGTIFTEGTLQQVTITNSMYGIGWVWKYAELFGYSGSSYFLAKDENNISRKMKTNGSILKFKAKYDFFIKRNTYDWIITPYGQVNNYMFSDYTNEKTTLPAEYYIYTVGLNAGVSF